MIKFIQCPHCNYTIPTRWLDNSCTIQRKMKCPRCSGRGSRAFPIPESVLIERRDVRVSANNSARNHPYPQLNTYAGVQQGRADPNYVRIHKKRRVVRQHISKFEAEAKPLDFSKVMGNLNPRRRRDNV